MPHTWATYGYLSGVEKEGLDPQSTVGLPSDPTRMRNLQVCSVRNIDTCLSVLLQLVGGGAPFPLQGTLRLPERQHLPKVIPAYRCTMSILRNVHGLPQPTMTLMITDNMAILNAGSRI